MRFRKSKHLAEKLKKEAGNSGKKMHVISRSGTWVVIKESSKRAIGKFKLKQQATNRARLLLNNGNTEVVIVHNTDGSIAEMLSSQNAEHQQAETV